MGAYFFGRRREDVDGALYVTPNPVKFSIYADGAFEKASSLSE